MDEPVLERPARELSPSAALPDADGGFLEILIKLSAWKFFILKFVFGCSIIAVVVALLWPKSYTATAKIMPPQQSQSIASAMLGQLGPMAALAGKDLGIRSAGDVYLYILKSRTISDDIIDHFGLMAVYKDKRRLDARNDLQKNTDIASGPEGGISISVVDRDPQRAADIANYYVDELRKLTQTLAVTEAGRRRLFFEHEVQQAGDDLAQAELAMKQTQQKTGIIQLDSQAKGMFEGLAKLQEQVAAKEVEVRSMQAFATPENPDLVRAQNELAALRSELARVETGRGGDSLADMAIRKVPEAGLEYLRRLRELKYREAVLEALTKQYEIARIDEAKDAAVIQVLDKALPPEVRSAPKRSLIVLTTAFLALCLAAMIALFAERVRDNPVVIARLQLLKFRLLGRSIS